jgi:hypothetical protein
MRPVRLCLVPTALTLALLAGCGSKISESNYYRVQYGMDEGEVDDLLGPSNEERAGGHAATGPATTPLADRKTKSWSRGHLTLRVTFEDGKVVGRSADGIAMEGAPTTRDAHSVSTKPT